MSCISHSWCPLCPEQEAQTNGRSSSKHCWSLSFFHICLEGPSSAALMSRLQARAHVMPGAFHYFRSFRQPSKGSWDSDPFLLSKAVVKGTLYRTQRAVARGPVSWQSPLHNHKGGKRGARRSCAFRLSSLASTAGAELQGQERAVKTPLAGLSELTLSCALLTTSSGSGGGGSRVLLQTSALPFQAGGTAHAPVCMTPLRVQCHGR